MDYEFIQDANHNAYVEQIIGLIKSNSQTNSMNMFIEKIIKQPEEYQILCNALYWFIKGPPIQQGGSDSPSLKRARTEEASPEAAVIPEVTPAVIPEAVAPSPAVAPAVAPAESVAELVAAEPLTPEPLTPEPLTPELSDTEAESETPALTEAESETPALTESKPALTEAFVSEEPINGEPFNLDRDALVLESPEEPLPEALALTEPAESITPSESPKAELVSAEPINKEPLNLDRDALVPEASNSKEPAELINKEPLNLDRDALVPEASPEPTTEDYQDKIIKNLEQLKSKTFITIPYKNKLLIDQGFKQSNYKHYLSFYIINQQYI